MSDHALARRRWALALIRRCLTPPPLYGSEEWASLPESHAAKVAAVVVAAEAWATEGDELEGRLWYEVEAERAAFKETEDAEYQARRDGHRAEWSNKSLRPHPANLPKPTAVVCLFCGTPTSPWSCSCGKTRVGPDDLQGGRSA